MQPFYLQRDNVFAVPNCPYSMEFTACVRHAFRALQPDCVAVDLPYSLEAAALHAASRLPDVSVIALPDGEFLMIEPCDGRFEALRGALEVGAALCCIGEVIGRPRSFPDSYALARIGLHRYYAAVKDSLPRGPLQPSELQIARRLKELSMRHQCVLLVADLMLAERLLAALKRTQFPKPESPIASAAQVCALTENSARQVMAEWGWITRLYEVMRAEKLSVLPDRQAAIYRLLSGAAKLYGESIGAKVPMSDLRPLMKFLRNYALLHHQLMPSLFQLVEAAKACFDDRFGYLIWELATNYPQKNIDNLPELDLSTDQVWPEVKLIRFRPRRRTVKGDLLSAYAKRHQRERRPGRRFAPNPFAICSYPPEDLVIEQFGERLKSHCTLLNRSEDSSSLPFSSGLEEGLDVRETLRQWHHKQLFVQAGRPPRGPAGAVVLIFDMDADGQELFPWKTCWHGEHGQESDMAFYATDTQQEIIGPGISRCQYGGFMMTYPPGRLYDVWTDPDYSGAKDKAEVLLMAAVDYSVDRHIVYVAAAPPRAMLKSYAARRAKRIVYLPIGQLAPAEIARIRAFHVLDGQDKRDIAGEYI